VVKGAAQRVNSVQDISTALLNLMNQPERLNEMGAKGLSLCEASLGASEKSLLSIAGMLKKTNG
jgi:hypothetical protein